VSAVASLSAWTRSVNELLAGLSKPVRTAAALLSLAVALARHCHGGRVAGAAPSTAAPASTRRRLERLLGNAGLHADAVTAALVRGFAAAWPADRRWVLIVDETDRDDRVRSLQVLLAYKRRAIPLACRAYRPSGGRGIIARVARLLALVRRNLPAGAHVTVLADRGLSWPALALTCRRLGLHYVLRVQGQAAVWRDGEPAWCRADALAPPRPGCRTWPARVFRIAGWVPCHFTAARTPGAREPWLLISDEPCGGRRHCRAYARRAWCESTFRDEKSGGFGWRDSRVDDPRRATRLLVLIALAVLLCLALGARLVRRGLRRQFDPHADRRLSYFQLGLRWLTHDALGCPDAPVMIPLVPP
jgi:Transposase DDE domain